MARILLGVSGGIAAYKALEFVRLATAAEHSLRVVQTPTSRRFVGDASFAALTGMPVPADEFEHDPARGAFPGQEHPSHQPLSHLQLVANADLYLVAPASANTLAKLAAGLADNLLSSCALAATCPLVVAPAMNNHMYEHPATQANLDVLRARGVHVVEPDVGRLASHGEHGVGRLTDPERLLAACEEVLATHAPRARASHAGSDHHTAGSDHGTAHSDRRTAGSDHRTANSDSHTSPPPAHREPSSAHPGWAGLRVLVTAGGTREPIDSVRFVGNSSSGRMGLALAEAALQRGADVTLVAANMALEPASGIEVRRVSTATELQEACEREFAACDVLLMAAAVADFRPAAPLDGKIKKGGRDRLTLELEPTADVLSGLSSRRTPEQTLVAFAAEHGPDGLKSARTKLSVKGVDAVVFNDISRPDIGFDSLANEVTILTGKGEQQVRRAPKESVADDILDAVERLRKIA
jgi:phosphopantothenoylcysteine decarboxylase / phosphopantothenate---cysteine ligase